jgi:hypothetical protein
VIKAKTRGRPTLAPELKASERIVVLLTPREKELVSQHCYINNISVSNYMSSLLSADLSL